MGMNQVAYLDHNATTPLTPAAKQALVAALDLVGNASSVHRQGRLVRRKIEDARAQVASLLGVPAEGIVFTGGGTEANNLAIRGLSVDRILVSAIEHPAVLKADDRIDVIPVLSSGHVDLEALDALLLSDTRPALVSVMAANNETGIVQPLAEVAAIAKRHGALVHSDAVQAAGKLDWDFGGLGLDLISLSAHKIGGPQGCGALYVRPGLALDPVNRGGGQEKGRRGGTENVPALVAFGAAAEDALTNRDWLKDAKALRDGLEAELRSINPACRIVGADVERLPNTTYVTMPNVGSETQVMAFDLAGVALSAGSACSSGKVSRSHVLEAMGLPEDISGCGVRVSLGRTTEPADVDRFIKAWADIAARAGGVDRASPKPAA
ncbi:MAG: cysteine desulfurase family protein [Magnetovibrionaceae bacterium]